MNQKIYLDFQCGKLIKENHVCKLADGRYMTDFWNDIFNTNPLIFSDFLGLRVTVEEGSNGPNVRFFGTREWLVSAGGIVGAYIIMEYTK